MKMVGNDTYEWKMDARWMNNVGMIDES